MAFLPSTSLFASDHADPIDQFSRERVEVGIIDLFSSRSSPTGSPGFPFHRTDGISLAMPDLKPRLALTPGGRTRTFLNQRDGWAN
jgi:hypothetical protein